jgi:hypothetical protein
MTKTVAFWIALAAQLVIGFFYLIAGLMVTPPALQLLWVWWGVLLLLLIIKREVVTVIIAVPLVAGITWVLALWFGDAYLGWTA